MRVLLLIFDSQSNCRTARALLQMGDWFSESPYPRIARCTVRWERATHSHAASVGRPSTLAHALTLKGRFGPLVRHLVRGGFFPLLFAAYTLRGVKIFPDDP
jgi:hypothetical protein